MKVIKFLMIAAVVPMYVHADADELKKVKHHLQESQEEIQEAKEELQEAREELDEVRHELKDDDADQDMMPSFGHEERDER